VPRRVPGDGKRVEVAADLHAQLDCTWEGSPESSVASLVSRNLCFPFVTP
jgi:hypothetical protein